MNANIDTMQNVIKTFDMIIVNLQYGVDIPIDYIHELYGVFNIAALDEWAGFENDEVYKLVETAYNSEDYARWFGTNIRVTYLLNLIEELNDSATVGAMEEIKRVSHLLNTVTCEF